MPRLEIVIAIMVAAGGAACGDNARAYDDPAEALVAQLSLDEKIAQLHGVRVDGVEDRTVPGLGRLSIPRFNVTNGPAGACYGGPGHEGPSTAMPAPIALAATWDVEAAREYGLVVGSEARAWGNALLEGPDINIARVPQSGRTFEGYGEDPLLVGRIATAFVQGAQAQGIIAEAKHFAANNQETDRGTISAEIDERTLREIYLPAFEATVKDGHVGAVMCAYNLINGVHACENDLLINRILKGEWGFEGLVTSDFYAVHDTLASARGGLDLEMPTGVYFGPALAAAVRAGTIDEAVLDDKLVRRYRTTRRLGAWVAPAVHPLELDAHALVARKIAIAGTVLLKNEAGALPMSAPSIGSIALIGPGAVAPALGGGGSSQVTPAAAVSPEAGLRARLGDQVQITVNDGSDLTAATLLAGQSSVAIVFVGDHQTEGQDGDLTLPAEQNALVAAVANANFNTIVVLRTGGPVLMPWGGQIHTLLEMWYPGEQDGAALAAMLVGDAEPGGRLPITFPVLAADLPTATTPQYPGVDGVAHYSEGVFVGYRHYDAHAIPLRFPFGFGLSYTSWSYGGLALSAQEVSAADPAITVRFDVTNIGGRTGAEVAQVYVTVPPVDGAPQPPRWLRGFAKVEASVGQRTHVEIPLDARAFAHWDVARHDWVITPGSYPISVGRSSRDLLLFGTLTIH
jgi:beta-glucosidase